MYAIIIYIHIYIYNEGNTSSSLYLYNVICLTATIKNIEIFINDMIVKLGETVTLNGHDKMDQSTSPNNIWTWSLDTPRWSYWFTGYSRRKSRLLLFKPQQWLDISRRMHGIKVFKISVHKKKLYITSWYISSAEPHTEHSQLRIGQVPRDMKLVAIDVPSQTPAHLLSTLKILHVVRKIQSSWQWNVNTNLAVV